MDPLLSKILISKYEKLSKRKVRVLDFLPKEHIQDIFCLYIPTELKENRTINETIKLYHLFNLKCTQHFFIHNTLYIIVFKQWIRYTRRKLICHSNQNKNKALISFQTQFNKQNIRTFKKHTFSGSLYFKIILFKYRLIFK